MNKMGGRLPKNVLVVADKLLKQSSDRFSFVIRSTLHCFKRQCSEQFSWRNAVGDNIYREHSLTLLFTMFTENTSLLISAFTLQYTLLFLPHSASSVVLLHLHLSIQQKNSPYIHLYFSAHARPHNFVTKEAFKTSSFSAKGFSKFVIILPTFREKFWLKYLRENFWIENDLNRILFLWTSALCFVFCVL